MTFGPVIFFFFFLLFVIWKVSTRGVYNIGWTKRYYIERIGEIIIINNFQQHRLGRRVWICFGENIGEKMEGKEKGTQTNAKSSRGRGTGSNLKVIASEQKWLWGSMPRWNENGSGGRRASREKTNKQNKRQKQLVCVGRIAREEKITPPFILREREMLMDECARKKGKTFFFCFSGSRIRPKERQPHVIYQARYFIFLALFNYFFYSYNVSRGFSYCDAVSLQKDVYVDLHFFVVISTFPKDPQFSISTTEREREKREITED